MSSPDEAEGLSETRVRRMVQQHLESLQRAGVTHVPRATRPAVLASSPVRAESSASTTAPAAKKSLPVESLPPAKPPLVEESPAAPPPATAPLDRVAALRVLQKDVAGCTRCKELAATRTQTVFGTGNPQPRVVFMGEAPGFDEDKQGKPFVGAAGQLLTKIIENGMGLRRDDVYILNTIKCRPPQNRVPAPDEVANCRGYFEQQLDLLRPEFLVCLGAVAAQNLLETTQSVGRLRGRFHDYRGIKVLVTYHPAYLLRNPDDKRKTWDDIQILMKEMGLPIKS